MHHTMSEILEHKGTEVRAIGPTASVAEAVRAMNEARVGALLIRDGERVVGIFSERDVLVRVVAEGRDVNATRVAEVMTPHPIAVGPETTVEQAMQVVTGRRIRHLPIMEAGQLLGLVSIGDLTSWVVRHQRWHIDDLVTYIAGAPPRLD